MIRERNIRQRQKLFEELNISQSKTNLASSLGIDKVCNFRRVD